MSKNEKFYKGLGVRAVVKMKKSSPFGRAQQTFHNVTEIHKNYPGAFPGKKVAIESDIHGSGVTYEMAHISRIVTKREFKKYKTL